MNIPKIVGYICTAAISITVILVTQEVFVALLITLVGFYMVSGDTD